MRRDFAPDLCRTYVDGLRGGNGMGEEIFGIESVEVLKDPSPRLHGQSVLGGSRSVCPVATVASSVSHG
jgi:iron complex outermembrane receptor protein